MFAAPMTTPDVPSLQRVPGGKIHERLYVLLRQGQIADEKRDRTSCLKHGIGQRQRVIAGASVGYEAFDATHGLVGKSLQPEYSGVIPMRQQPLVELKPDDVRPAGDLATRHALDAPPRAFQVAQDKQRNADQTVAEPVGRIGRFRRIGAKSFGRRQRRPIAAAREAALKQAPNRSQATIRIVEAFRDLKGACPGR